MPFAKITDLMLNIELIQAKRRERGLSGAELAELCGVSREAVSNWLKGESEPRPSKAVALAKALELELREVLGLASPLSAPVVAYRTRLNREVSEVASSSAQELAENMRRLLPQLPKQAKISVSKDPEAKATEGHVRTVALTMRSRLGLSELDAVEERHLLELFRHFGAILVPVLWGLDKENHENALSVYLPDTESSFVVFNIGCKSEDYLYWLSHEFGHCLSLHSLQGKEGEDYAELFAQQFLFTSAAAAICSEEIGTRKGEAAFRIIDSWSERYGISSVTVLRAVDKYRASKDHSQKLERPLFWSRYEAKNKNSRSVVSRELGTDSPDPQAVIEFAKSHFGSPIYEALGKLQQIEGGRVPTVIQSTLMLPFANAVGLSVALWRAQD